jgi:hypothetical protein
MSLACILGACGTERGTRVTVIDGMTSAVNEHGTAIFLSQTRSGASEGYVIAGAMWRNAGGAWNEWNGPSCAEPLSSGQHVRLGIVHVAPEGDAPGRAVVAWFECLD